METNKPASPDPSTLAALAVAAAVAGLDDHAAGLLRLLRSVDADHAVVVAAECYGASTDWIW